MVSVVFRCHVAQHEAAEPYLSDSGFSWNSVLYVSFRPSQHSGKAAPRHTNLAKPA